MRGGFASFGAAAIILKMPVPAGFRRGEEEIQLCSRHAIRDQAKVALFNPIKPEALKTLSHGICGIGLGASGFGSGGGMCASTSKKVFALNQP